MLNYLRPVKIYIYIKHQLAIMIKYLDLQIKMTLEIINKSIYYFVDIS